MSKISENLSRRALVAGVPVLAGAAALPSSVAACAAAESDPIFAAIDEHRRLRAAHQLSLQHHTNLENELAHNWRLARFHAAETQIAGGDPRWTNHPMYMASARAMDVRWDAVMDSAYELINVRPATRAGAVALLRYIAEIEAGDEFCLPEAAYDDADARVSDHGADFAYFIYRNVADALGATV